MNPRVSPDINFSGKQNPGWPGLKMLLVLARHEVGMVLPEKMQVIPGVIRVAFIQQMPRCCVELSTCFQVALLSRTKSCRRVEYSLRNGTFFHFEYPIKLA